MRHVWRLLVVAAAAVMGGIAGAASPAGAHASLIASEPGYNAALATLPPTVTLEFNDKIEADLSHLTVIYGDEELRYTRIESGPTTVVTFNADVAAVRTWTGEAMIRWRVYAFDGHTMQGAIPIFVGVPPPESSTVSETGAATPDDSTLSLTVGWAELLKVSRLAVHVSLVLLGAALFWAYNVAHVHPRLRPGVNNLDERLRQWGGWLLSGSSALYAVSWAGSAWGVVDSTAVAADVLTSGTFVGSTIVAVGAVMVARSRSAPMMLAVVGAAAVHLAGSSHSAEGRWAPLSVAVGAGHILAVAAWVGAVVGFAALRYSPEANHPQLARFCSPALHRLGKVAAASVVALAATGIFQMWTISDGAPGGRWGAVLVIKLAVAVVVVGPLGFTHHMALRSARRGRGGWPTLRRSLLWEVAGLGAVIGLGVLLASTPQ